MYCSDCGGKLEQGTRFCTHCGRAVAAATTPDRPAQQPPSAKPDAAPKAPKGRCLLFGLSGTAVGALLLAVILFAAGILAPGGTAKTEGAGFATPEDAAKAYLTGLKNQDMDAMISVFAVESYVDNYDFGALVERLMSYVPTFEIRLPNTNEYTRQMNIASRRNQIAGSILNQYMCFNTPDQLNDYTPTMLKDPEAVADFVEAFERDTKDYIFSDLKITGTMAPEELLDVYYDEANQQNIARQAITFGADADDVANIIVTFEADGQTWLFCPQAVRYNGRWYLQSLQGNIAILLGMTVFTGGMSPFPFF